MSKFNFFVISLSFLVSFSIIQAHEEPSKNKKEKTEKETIRKHIRSSKVKSIDQKEYIYDKQEERFSKDIMNIYDKNGNLSEIIVNNYSDSSVLKVVYRYNIFDDMIEEISTKNDRLIDRDTFSYYSSGHVMGGYTYDSLNQIEGKFKWECFNNTIVFLKYKNNDILDYQIKYIYSENFDNGNLIEADKINNDSTQNIRAIYEYSRDRLSDKSIFKYDGTLSHKFHYEYDGSGNQIEIKKSITDGETQTIYKYKYDNKNNITETMECDKNDTRKKVVKYFYEYYK
jgi:hypothetical protein